MGCSSCGKKGSDKKTLFPMGRTSGRDNVMADDSLVMVQYDGPVSEKPIYGQVTRNFYGMRSGGEKFLIHRDDLRDTRFKEEVSQARPTPPSVIRAAPPPPPRIVKTEEWRREVQSPNETEEQERTVIDDAIEVQAFDIATVPGVTPNVARRLVGAHLATPKAIIDAGESGLKNVKGIGPARAGAIYGYISDRYGDGDPDSGDGEAD